MAVRIAHVSATRPHVVGDEPCLRELGDPHVYTRVDDGDRHRLRGRECDRGKEGPQPRHVVRVSAPQRPGTWAERPIFGVTCSCSLRSEMAAAGRSGIRVDLRGSGAASVETGLPVFDRLLERLAEYARFDLALEVEPGAAEADVAEAGSALGRALAEPLRASGARGFGSAW